MADPNISSRLVAKVQVTRKQQVITLPRAAAASMRRSTVLAAKKQVQIHVQIRQSPGPNHVAAPAAIVNSNRVTTILPQQRQPLRQQPINRQPPKPHYITADVGRDDLERLRNVRGAGRGRILVIVGNGPSINEVDLPKLVGHAKIDLMSINKPDSRVWPTKYWAFCDLSQFRRHRALWDSYNGTIFNSTSITQRRPGTIHIKNLGGRGFSQDLLRGFHIGRSSVYAAMQIALWLDYDQTYVVGVDMCSVNGQMHFYGVNPDVTPDARKERFKAEADHYDFAANLLAEPGRRRFTFCSAYLAWPFAEKFNKLDHRTAIGTILNAAATK